MELVQFLEKVNKSFADKGLAVTVGPENVGTGFTRLDVGGRGNFWYRLDKAAKGFVLVWGDFRTGEQGHLFSGEENQAALKRIRADLREEKRRLHEKAASEVGPVWDACLPAGTHPYLTKKGIRLHGARLAFFPETEVVSHVVVPMRLGYAGVLENLQHIDEQGNKSLWPGGQTHGVHFWLGTPTPKRVIVCEGYATGASVYESLNEPEDLAVLCAMSADNLTATVAYILKAFQKIPLTIAADNDRTKKSNAGVKHATRAGSQASHIRIVHPPALEGVSDFNDLMLLKGKEAVAECFEDRELAITSETLEAAPKKPNENQIASLFAKELTHHCVVEDDIFAFTGTHWHMWDEADHVRLHNQIREVSGGQYKTGDVRSCKQAILDRLPRAPGSLLKAKRDSANFLNGTLHLRGKHDFVLKPHAPEDGMMSLFPFTFEDSLFEARSSAWEDYVRGLFAHEADCDEKVMALSEMFGAMLMPRYPHLFMLHGGAGCGKSTIIKVALKLTRADDVGSVAPTHFGREFYLESLIGKTINAVTDIGIREPINDELVKQVEDQRDFFVNRKGKRAILAPLPPIHIFGGNGIPKTLDGASGAHERRWTFIEFTKRVATNEAYDRDFADDMFRGNERGILGFALRGLLRLVKTGGMYTQPASGRATMREWEKETDSVAQFLDAVDEGEIRHVKRDTGGEILSGALWAAFKHWAEDTNSGGQRMSQTSFSLRLKKLGVAKAKREKGMHWVGFSADTGRAREL